MTARTKVPKKQEPQHVCGSCVICGAKQVRRGHDIHGRRVYRATCQTCHSKRYGIGPLAYRAHKKGHCEDCGFKPVHPCQLDVDHADGDHSNDDPANLVTRCANCHRLKTFFAKDHLPR